MLWTERDNDAARKLYPDYRALKKHCAGAHTIPADGEYALLELPGNAISSLRQRSHVCVGSIQKLIERTSCRIS